MTPQSRDEARDRLAHALERADFYGLKTIEIPIRTEDLRALISPEQGWREIESAPGFRVPVLLIGRYPTGNGWSDIYHGWRNAGGSNWDRWPHDFKPTHYQPLPAPPTKGGE